MTVMVTPDIYRPFWSVTSPMPTVFCEMELSLLPFPGKADVLQSEALLVEVRIQASQVPT